MGVLPSKTRTRALQNLERCMSTSWTVKDGAELADFEEKVAGLFGTAHAVATNNGTNALMAAASVLDLQRGDRILVPAYGFYGMLAPFLFLGISPVFVPVDLLSLSAGVAEYELGLPFDPAAVLVFPPWGCPVGLDSVAVWAQHHGLPTVSDLSHCHGGKFGRKRLGTFSTISAASFGAGKLLDGGELGACMTDSQDLRNRLIGLGHPNRSRRPCASEPGNGLVSHSFGPKLRPHKAALAMALAQFDGFEERLRERRSVALRMQEIATQVGGLEALRPEPKAEATWWRLVLKRSSGWDQDAVVLLRDHGFPLDSAGYSCLLSHHPILDSPRCPRVVHGALPVRWLSDAQDTLPSLGYFAVPTEETAWERKWLEAMKDLRGSQT